MKIVIMAGGTGSIALQTGLHKILPSTGVDMKVITNAYDNGLSTGAVRRVMGGKILGPSDVRKNQTTHLKLVNPSSHWNSFLDIRFSEPATKAKEFCLKKVDELHDKLMGVHSTKVYGSDIILVREAIDEYFSVPAAVQIDYTDFSLANIVYAGFAKANGYSLRKAASIMAKILKIEDNVLVNDDRSLFLGGITKSGKRITDEGDIVSWGDLEDPFVDIFFVDAEGKSAIPVLCDEADKAIKEADYIILSSGTQWSSLIPTYNSLGFRDSVKASKAKVIMVMNRVPDKDSPGQNANDIIDILVPKYFDSGRLTVVTDTSGDAKMHEITEHTRMMVDSVVSCVIGEGSSPKVHNAFSLAKTIGKAMFGISDLKTTTSFLFDYDDTVVARGNTSKQMSDENIEALHYLNHSSRVAICSGNSIKAINLGSALAARQHRSNGHFTVYADGGVNEYSVSTDHKGSQEAVFEKCLDNSVVFSAEQVAKINRVLSDIHISTAKVENRNNVSIAIKPVDDEYRAAIVMLLVFLLDGEYLNVQKSGRSTIEIHKHGLSKYNAIKQFLGEQQLVAKSANLPLPEVLYIGDEIESGNDAPIKDIVRQYTNISYVQVPSVAATNFLLKIILLMRHHPAINL